MALFATSRPLFVLLPLIRLTVVLLFISLNCPARSFFFPKCGRYSSEARALKLDKQSKAAKQGRKNESSPYKNEPTVANKQQTNRTATSQTKCKSPSQICVSPHKKRKQQQHGARAQRRNNTNCHNSFFFSSGMADHALRLGPYMRRSNY